LLPESRRGAEFSVEKWNNTEKKERKKEIVIIEHPQ